MFLIRMLLYFLINTAPEHVWGWLDLFTCIFALGCLFVVCNERVSSVPRTKLLTAYFLFLMRLITPDVLETCLLWFYRLLWCYLTVIYPLQMLYRHGLIFKAHVDNVCCMFNKLQGKYPFPCDEFEFMRSFVIVLYTAFIVAVYYHLIRGGLLAITLLLTDAWLGLFRDFVAERCSK